MYLRCRGYRTPLAVQSLLGEWLCSEWAGLKISARHNERPFKNYCPWHRFNGQAYPFTTGASETLETVPTELSVTPQQALESSLRPPSAFDTIDSIGALDQARYASQRARYVFNSKPKPYKAISFGKNKADKVLVSQLLKDKGQTSHDWRIPLSQLDKHFKPLDVEKANRNRDNLRSIGLAGPVRDDGSCPPSISTSPRKVSTYVSRGLLLARDIPEPASWSARSLFNYIVDVAKSQNSQTRIPRPWKPRHPQWSNRKDIHDIFFYLLRQSDTKKYLTTDACNIVLRFFSKHSMFSSIRKFYVGMKSMKMNIPAETFNVILRGAASQRDLHTFNFLLYNMIQQGFQPDEVTWVSLVMAINSMAVKAVIVNKIEEMGALNQPRILADIATQMIPNEFILHLKNGRSLEAFLNHMDSRYGSRWLSTAGGNTLLNESSKRRTVIETLDLLGSMKLRGFMPDDISINILVHKCLLYRQYNHAIEVLHTFQSSFGLSPGSEVYQTLFLHAWRHRMLNFSRVIWRLASMYGCVSFLMRDLVFQSMKASHSGKCSSLLPSIDNKGRLRQDEARKFLQLAGNFVVGVRDPQRLKLATCDQNSLAQEPGFSPRRIQRSLIRARIDDDLCSAYCFQSKAGMVELLRRAIALDRQWKHQGIWRIGQPRHAVQNGIQLELEQIRILPTDGEGSHSKLLDQFTFPTSSTELQEAARIHKYSKESRCLAAY